MTRRNAVLLSFALVMLSPWRAAADYFLVNAEQVRSMLKGTRKLLLVDSRTPAEFEQAHLPRAMNIPADQMRAEAARLPKDKSTAIVFYCRGSGCTLSPAAARDAGEMGYTNVSVYQAGIPDWLLKGYPIEKGPEICRGTMTDTGNPP
jgi:rhodanese-related sulfurtransferase